MAPQVFGCCTPMWASVASHWKINKKQIVHCESKAVASLQALCLLCKPELTPSDISPLFLPITCLNITLLPCRLFPAVVQFSIFLLAYMLLLLLALAEEFKWCPASLQQLCCWLHENNSARNLLTLSAIVINFGLASTDIVSIAETAFFFSEIERITQAALSTNYFCPDLLCSYGAFLTSPPGRLKWSTAPAQPHVHWPSAHTLRSAFVLWPQMKNI